MVNQEKSLIRSALVNYACYRLTKRAKNLQAEWKFPLSCWRKSDNAILGPCPGFRYSSLSNFGNKDNCVALNAAKTNKSHFGPLQKLINFREGNQSPPSKNNRTKRQITIKDVLILYLVKVLMVYSRIQEIHIVICLEF